MKVSLQGGSALGRHRQQLRDLADQEQARADGYAQKGAEDQAKGADLNEKAAENRQTGTEKKTESNRLRRNGREQSLRGLERLSDASDRYAESFSGSEKGLTDLQQSLDGMTAAHQTKGEALETINQGLTQQADHNANQTEILNQFQGNQDQDLALDPTKAEQLQNLNQNQTARQEGFQRQLSGFGDYLLAGARFDDGSKVKREGFRSLSQAAEQQVQAEHTLDARDHKNVEKTWAQTDQEGHEKTSNKLYFSSLFESLKAKAAELAAATLLAEAAQENQSADAKSAQANEIKANAAALLNQARHMEYCGQNHIVQGRQMQACPWTYHQGVCLERQGHCEVAEAQRQKQCAQQMRARGQAMAMEAEELRVKAEQNQARGEEFEVKGHGNQTRARILGERSDEHEADGVKAGQDADRAAAKAAEFEQAAQEMKSAAAASQELGQRRLSEGLDEQNAALQSQATTSEALNHEFTTETDLSQASKLKAGEAIATVARERTFIRRGKSLLGQLQTSHTAEQATHQSIQGGIDKMRGGLDDSADAQQKGVEAAKLLEQARDLELEGLRLQNRGQKMMLEARPKMSAAARLSAESFDHLKQADQQDTEAARLIEQGRQKLAAAEVLRDKAAAYREIAG